MITGGKDGNVLLRRVSNPSEQPTNIKAHSVFSGGISAICVSQNKTTLYTAGGDGSIFSWNIGGKPTTQAVTSNVSANAAIKKLPELMKVHGSQIKLYKQILKEEFEIKEEAAKEEFK